MTINLEAGLPLKHLGAFQSLQYFGGHSAFVLAHMVNAFLILGASISFLAMSFRSGHASLRVCSAVAFASVVGALVNGLLFLTSGQDFGWSVGMAMSAVSAIVVSGISLYFVGIYTAVSRASLGSP